ncbi:unnamed protein product [Thelazia callipaeda]|uniref:Uncharacterized protein n=1 Tax=Thelazia callipaeda TaxID=103827 RepID=A0A0N5CVL6_THECL|nr:unnamed protein product [Thelazia callipaeda]
MVHEITSQRRNGCSNVKSEAGRGGGASRSGVGLHRAARTRRNPSNILQSEHGNVFRSPENPGTARGVEKQVENTPQDALHCTTSTPPNVTNRSKGVDRGSGCRIPSMKRSPILRSGNRSSVSQQARRGRGRHIENRSVTGQDVVHNSKGTAQSEDSATSQRDIHSTCAQHVKVDSNSRIVSRQKKTTLDGIYHNVHFKP